MKKRSAVVDYAGYLGLAGIVAIGRYAPKWARYGFYGALMGLTFRLWKRRREVTVENLRVLYPDASDEKLLKIAEAVFTNLGRFCVEFCSIPKLKPETLDRFVRFKGWEHLENAHKRGKGVVLVTAHYDNFELMNAAISVKGMPVYSVIREVDIKRADELLDGIRNMAGVTVIKRELAATEIFKRIREGNVVTIAMDQSASFNSVFVKFMGKWAATFRAPAVTHKRTGAPMVPAYSVREEDGTHTIKILPEIKPANTGNLKRDIYLITQELADIQADFISKRPELWFWLHRRWKIQPNAKEIEKIENFAGRTPPVPMDIR